MWSLKHRSLIYFKFSSPANFVNIENKVFFVPNLADCNIDIVCNAVYLIE